MIMRKQILSIIAIASCSYSAIAQNALDQYFTGTNNLRVIGNASTGLVNPQDLDFVPGTNTWWVLNYEANSGSMVIFYDAGKTSQSSEFRRDSHSAHFMIRPSALAIGDNGNFATTQDIQNTNPNAATFMGPALWSTDTSIFARQEQSNWDPNKLLGSHLDMLHQSPFAMGIAHEKDNIYWVYDGYNGNICKYDFKAEHIVGGDDHADGEIFRYSDVTVKRESGLPSHMVLDKQNNWLYIVDGGNSRVIRMKTTTGNDVGGLTPPISASEPLAKYRNITGATVEVVATGLNRPCGIDYKNNRIIVSEEGTGDIIMFDVSTSTATEVGRIKTGAVGVMGVRIDWDNGIWYVNRNRKEVVKVENSNVPTSIKTFAKAELKVYPVPAKDYVTIELGNNHEATIMIADMSGRMTYRGTMQNKTSINTTGWAMGVYTLMVKSNKEVMTQKIVIE